MRHGGWTGKFDDKFENSDRFCKNDMMKVMTDDGIMIMIIIIGTGDIIREGKTASGESWSWLLWDFC